jgi:ankyrin repeat protein
MTSLATTRRVAAELAGSVLRIERDEAMAHRYRRTMYSGKQFILTLAAVIIGLAAFTAIRSAARTSNPEANGGQAELYMVDPFTYGTSSCPDWERSERLIDAVRKAEAAARKGDTGTLRKLVRRGLKVDRNLGDGQTLLMLACENGRTELARYLVEQGANVKARDIRGNTPESLAAKNGHAEIVRLLASSPSEQMARQQAIRRGEG